MVTTDQSGIYEIDGLQPDNYTLKVELPDTQISREDRGPERQREIKKEEFTRQPVIERDFHVAWNGTIEGTVKDLAGHPAHSAAAAANSRWNRLRSYHNFTGGTRDDGSFRFEQVPAGRYVIMVNPDGPGKGWPYESQYYPSAVQIGGAHVFEIAEGLRQTKIVLPLAPDRRPELGFSPAETREITHFRLNSGPSPFQCCEYTHRMHPQSADSIAHALQ